MNMYKTPGQILAEENFAKYKAADNSALRQVTWQLNQLKNRLQDREEKIDALMKRTLWQRIWNDPV